MRGELVASDKIGAHGAPTVEYGEVKAEFEALQARLSELSRGNPA